MNEHNNATQMRLPERNVRLPFDDRRLSTPMTETVHSANHPGRIPRGLVDRDDTSATLGRGPIRDGRENIAYAAKTSQL